MMWTPRDDQTLGLVRATDAERDLARARAQDVAARGGDAELDVSAHLQAGLRDGLLQARTLVRLGELCHAHGPSRDAARSASDALFGFILPTPTAGLHADYFWRVARRLDADGHIAEAAPARTLQHRSFSTRVDAAVFGTQIGERLVSVTECSGSGGVETTVWYWEG